jgi:hydrogenase-4 component F
MAKPLAFFSAGNLARQYKSHDMHDISGAVSKNRLWGGAFLAAVLALAGMAPFAVFMSEFQIVKATLDTGRYVQLALFLAGAIVVFASASRHAIAVSLGTTPSHVVRYTPRATDYAIVCICLVAMLVFGLWMPEWLKSTLQQAALIIENRAALPWSIVP